MDQSMDLLSGGGFLDHVLKATSHTRPRARDHYTSSTLIGGEGWAAATLVHTTLEGPME